MPVALPPVEVNPAWTGYVCTVCARAYDRDWDRFVCADCGVDGILEATYDLDAVGAALAAGAPFGRDAAAGLWRYAPLLPMRPSAPHSAWTVGATPLHAPENLRRALGLPHLWLKDDTGLPSASLKDRAAAMAIADASRRGLDHVACASTGNAAASLAVLGARAGLASTIFVPAAAPRAKLAQLLLHGARVIRVDGTYDQAFDLSLREIERHGWYSRNCAHNPLLVEGKKTAGLEVAEALGFDPPDAVFVPVGDGCIVSSTGRAFADLAAVGVCSRTPRIYGIQAAGASPLAQAWSAAGGRARALAGGEILAAVHPVDARTRADSICVGVPRNRVKAWRRVADSGGAFLTVTDDEILDAVALLARTAGVWAEPSGAAGVAGLLAARRDGLVADGERVVVMVTGHGLKDPGAALDRVELPEPVPPEAS